MVGEHGEDEEFSERSIALIIFECQFREGPQVIGAGEVEGTLVGLLEWWADELDDYFRCEAA